MDRINAGGRGEALQRYLKGKPGRPPYQTDADSASKISGRGAFLSAYSTPKTKASGESLTSNGLNGHAVAGMGRASFFERISRDIGSFPQSSSDSSGRSSVLSSSDQTPDETSDERGERAPVLARGSSGQLDSGCFPQTSPDSSGRSSMLSATEIQSMSSLSLEETSDEREERAPVLARGSSGQPITVVTNYFELQIEDGRGIHQYHVKFSPIIDSRNVRERLLRQIANVIQHTKSFDGAILYLPIKLPEKITTVETENHDGSVVTITITFVKTIKMAHREAIHLMNVTFRRIMSILGHVQHGRNFFDPRTAMQIPEHKLELWPGVVSSIQEYEGGVMLCCDASHRVLRTQTVYDLILQVLDGSTYFPATGDKKRETEIRETEIRDMLIGQPVLTKYNNKVYVIDDVDFLSSPKNTFLRQDKQVTYIDYYREAYNKQINDHDQPLLKSKVKTKIKGQEMTNYVDLVPELCYLTGLTDAMRSDHRMMKALAHHTRIPPAARQKALEQFLRNVHNSPEACALLGAWGFTLASKSLQLPGRLLQPERIILPNHEERLMNSTKDWTRAVSSNRVCSAINLDQWMILVAHRDENLARGFVKTMQDVTKRLGIVVREPFIVGLLNDHVNSYLQKLRETAHKEFQVVVCIMGFPRKDAYTAIKKQCCIVNPIPSQVILARTIRDPKKLRAVTTKIALQMNCKLGGTLWEIPIPTKDTMVIGFDTHHDANRVSGSVGAVVASMNESMTRWFSTIYRQEVGEELIVGLEMAVTRALSKWRELNGKLPRQIIVYRDGLGDGQLNVCSQLEVPQLIRAGMKLSVDYSPKFLFVVVQKRINTRLFVYNQNELSNPYCGTVMDHTITRRDFADFFLVSQNVQDGTVRPTHYVVLKNDTSMTYDQVQRYTYKMTHLYYNWSGQIRVPAPCQYAHKLAYIVGEHVGKEADARLSDKLWFL